MANEAAQGSQARLAFKEGSGAVDMSSGSTQMEFLDESLTKDHQHIDPNQIRGTRSHQQEMVVVGLTPVDGTIRMNPSPLDLDLLLPWILGADESTDTFALAETLQEFSTMIDRVTDVFQYTDCLVSRAVFSSSEGGLLELAMDVMAKDESDAGTFPGTSLGVTTPDKPYSHSESVLTLGGNAIAMQKFELTIDNAIDRRFFNSNTATSLCPADRMVGLTVTTAYKTANEKALYDSTATATGFAGDVTFTKENMSLVFSLADLKRVGRTPVVNGKNEILHEISYEARQSGATKELIVTNDSEN